MLTGFFRSGGSILFAAIVLVGFSNVSLGCQVCVPLPTKTMADRIIEGDTVVLARENPANPFHYLAYETLKGSSEVDEIDLFMNSSFRRMLQSNPESGVLLVHNASSDQWHNLGFADPSLEKVAREIVNYENTWQKQNQKWGSAQVVDELRIEYFASLVGSDNRAIHELAYLELGRAPYDVIRRHSDVWSLDEVRRYLGDPRKFEWFPLAILMLGFNAEELDRKRIQNSVRSSAKVGATVNLSAWATAFVEIGGSAAVDEIVELFFVAPGRERAALNAVITAVSVQGTNGNHELRDDIVQGYSVLLDNYPEMVPLVTRDLVRWKHWELTEQLADLLQTVEDSDHLSAMAIRSYLEQADNS